MTKFKIVDWAFNEPFPSKEFETFEDGWSFLMKTFDNDEDLQEFSVIKESLR